MSTKFSADLSSTERTERRARWEVFAFRVPAEGRVRVENRSYGEESPEHVYVVSVANGEAVACSCPADEYQPGACKHRLAVANQEAVILAASANREESRR
jgi:hypothetical protein